MIACCSPTGRGCRIRRAPRPQSCLAYHRSAGRPPRQLSVSRLLDFSVTPHSVVTLAVPRPGVATAAGALPRARFPKLSPQHAAIFHTSCHWQLLNFNSSCARSLLVRRYGSGVINLPLTDRQCHRMQRAPPSAVMAFRSSVQPVVSRANCQSAGFNLLNAE